MKIPPAISSILILVASIGAGIGGFVATAVLFDSMNWCCFHSWALIHGTGVVVFLLWAYAGFHVASLVAKAREQFAPIPNLAFVSTALGTNFFTEFFMWPGLLLCGYGIYRRFRRGDRAAAGLLWSATIVSSLVFAYWLYLTILFASLGDLPG